MLADDVNLPALAAAIIRQAITDAAWTPRRAATSFDAARHHAKQRQHRVTARAFLDSNSLEFWCAVANVNADRIRAAIRDGLLERRIVNNRYPTQRKQRAEICAA
jgi:hypothetical protein